MTEATANGALKTAAALTARMNELGLKYPVRVVFSNAAYPARLEPETGALVPANGELPATIANVDVAVRVMGNIDQLNELNRTPGALTLRLDESVAQKPAPAPAPGGQAAEGAAGGPAGVGGDGGDGDGEGEGEDAGGDDPGQRKAGRRKTGR